MIKKVLFVCLLLLLITNVYALGVTPGKKIFELKDGADLRGSFKIINNDQAPRELVISTRGDFSDISLEKRRVSLAASDPEAIVSYTVTVPDDLKPGRHRGEIVISEEVENSGGDDTIVGAVLSVVTQVEIYIPYPGKYAEASIIANNAGTDENVAITIPVLNLGEFDLANVYANVDIYSDLGERIDSFNTQSISITSKDKGDIMHNWKAEVPVGRYKAIATVIYDGESLTTEDTFQVGTVSLELQQLTVNNFVLGQIAKMDLLVENQWSETFEDVYTQVKIFSDDGTILADFNSASEDVQGLSKKVLSSFWDTAGVQEGTYDTKVIIHYSGSKNIETDLQLVVSSDSIQVIGLGFVLAESGDRGFNLSDSLVVILVIIIAILILLNLLWFFILRRIMKKK